MRNHLLSLLISVFVGQSFIHAQSNPMPALLQNLQTAPNDSLRCAALFQLCLHYLPSDADSLAFYAQKLLETAERGQLPRFKISGQNALGLAAKNKGDLEPAVRHFLAALAESERIHDSKKEANVLLNLADAMRLQGQFGKAQAYHQRGLRLAEQMRDTVLLAKFSINTGLVFANQKMVDSAYFFYRKAYDLLGQNSSIDFLSLTIKSNLAALAHQRRDFREMEKIAREVLEESRRADNPEHIYFGGHNLGVALRETGRAAEAIPYFREAEAAAEKMHFFEGQVTAKGGLLLALQATGRHEEGLKEAIAWAALRDSLSKSTTDRNAAELEARYQNSQQAAELAEKNLQLERQRNRQNLLIFSALAIVALAVGGFLFFRNRQRLREKEAQLALQLEHAEAEKLRELDQMKSVFFANISHEFRTPLTLLLGPLREMRDGTFRGDAPHFLKIMVRNAERLLQLINQLLDLSKLESGKLKLQPAEGDLSAFLRAIVGSFESMAARRNMVLEAKFPAAPLAADFDKDVLEKILTNLLSNAFKFSPDEGRVSFEAQAIENQLTITLRDEGVGIPPEQLPHIFERFYQANTPKTDDSAGSGIGLALTKELVELHGGNISVESQLGTGTAFTVSLPMQFLENGRRTISSPETTTRVAVSLENEGISATPAHTPLKTQNSKLKTALVADDNADVRAYIVGHLRDEYRILEAPDGLAALEMARTEMPDLIVTDIMMPRMDGTELTRQLKTDPRTSHIPVVMLTAKAGQTEKIEGLETGADDYLTKPFDGRELQIRARNLVESRAQLRAKFAGEIRVQPKDVVVNSVDEQFLRRTLDAIEQKMDDEHFSVEDLAGAVGMSRSQLHRKLTALAGLSPVEIIRKMRLERARDLLAQGAGNVSEVAYRVGFSSASYFSTCFSEHFGVAPGEVARRHG